MSLDQIRELIGSDIQAVDKLILDSLHSNVLLINQIGHYIVNSGGKRLRPLLVLLAARTCNYTGNNHIDLAAIIEFIHTATLLHDDVVDASDMRRGNETANAIWGNEASVLVGDFLYSRAFEMMVKTGSMRIMEIMAHTTNTIAEGEVMQLLNCNDADTTEARYMDVVQRKTAILFEAASRIGAILGKQDTPMEQALANYGRHLGLAFQLIDDALDYSADPEETGKNLGDDLAEGKPTLPLIYAMRTGNKEQQQIIRHAIEQGGHEHIDSVQQIIKATNAIKYTTQSAHEQAEKAIHALTTLPESPYKDALHTLAEFSVHRSY
ncbi:MAG: octaprenyl diphosphate synthase [Gammaproteobacteria bacterium]|nr:octaprenyl diphosphate synthase [Gammaproteobacteria bacterium]